MFNIFTNEIKKTNFFIFLFFLFFTPFFLFFEPFSDHPSFSHIHGSILDHPVLHIFTNEVKKQLYEQFLPMTPGGVIRLISTPGGVIHVCDMSGAKANVRFECAICRERFVVCDLSCFATTPVTMKFTWQSTDKTTQSIIITLP